MQEFKTAPAEKEAHNKLGHAAAVCSGIIVVGIVVGVITEVLPLQSMANAAIGQYLVPLIGSKATYFLTSFITCTFVIYLAKEHLRASRAAFSTFDKYVREQITGYGVVLLWIVVVFVVGLRFGLTFIGSHQIAYVAVTPPSLNTATIAANDSIHNIRNSETAKEYDKQRQRLLADNKEALKAAKKLAIASEANALKEVKNAPNEYRRNIATQKLKELRAKNAEQIAVVSAQGSQALLTLSASQNNVIAGNDSLNNAAKGMIISADAHAQRQYFWLSNKITAYLPYISLICVLLVTVAVFVLCLIERACGITTTFQQGRYENLPGLPTVYMKAISDVWQSHNRAFAAGIKRFAERDLFKDGMVDAAAVGAGNTVQVSGNGSVQDVKIRNNATEPLSITHDNEPITTKKEVHSDGVGAGVAITMFQAKTRLNSYNSKIKNNEGVMATNKARVRYLTYLIETMTKHGTDSMIAPPFDIAKWS